MSLVEILMAGSFLTVACVALSQALVASMATSDRSHEVSRALHASKLVLETMKNEPFEELFARYNADASDDPAGASPWTGFEVTGLQPLANDLDGAVGEVMFPTVAGELREDVQDASLGMPRDLDGDGAIGSGDRSNDYGLLPIRVRVRWLGAKGPMSVELRTLLTRTED